MAFTSKDSIQTIMDTPGVGDQMDYYFPVELLRFVPEELWTHPLEEVGRTVTMPWGMPFGTEAFVSAANGVAEIWSIRDKLEYVPLWGGEQPGYLPDYGKNDKSAVSLMAFKRAVPERPLPAVIICPGGGYETLARENEGYTVAKRMEAADWRAFVLNYRVKPNYWPEPDEDLALAVKYVRANCGRFGADPHRLMIMGFSAGGHLCASYAAWHEELSQSLLAELEREDPERYRQYREIDSRPDMVCLGYPVVAFGEECIEPCYRNLAGDNETLREKLSIDRQVTADYPKTFVWACEDDELVPVSHAARMGEALDRAGVPHMLRIYPTGGHGCALAERTSARSWTDEMLAFLA